MLRRGVFRSVRRRHTEDHSDGQIGEILLGLLEKGHAVVDDEIGEVIAEIVVPVLDLPTIKVDGIIVKARVLNEADPFSPAGRDVRTIVLVEIFAKISGPVTDVGKIRGERPRLMSLTPMSARAVIVVGVNVVVVDVET